MYQRLSLSKKLDMRKMKFIPPTKEEHAAFNRCRSYMMSHKNIFTSTELLESLLRNGIRFDRDHITMMCDAQFGLLDKVDYGKNTKYSWHELIDKSDFSSVNPSYNTYSRLLEEVKKKRNAVRTKSRKKRAARESDEEKNKRLYVDNPKIVEASEEKANTQAEKKQLIPTKVTIELDIAKLDINDFKEIVEFLKLYSVKCTQEVIDVLGNVHTIEL